MRHAVFQGADWFVEVAAGSAVLRVRYPDEEPPAVGSAVSVGYDPMKAWIVAGALSETTV